LPPTRTKRQPVSRGLDRHHSRRPSAPAPAQVWRKAATTRTNRHWSINSFGECTHGECLQCLASGYGYARTHTPSLVTQQLACLRQLISFTLVARARIEQTLFVRGRNPRTTDLRNRAISSYRRTAAWRLSSCPALPSLMRHQLAATLATRRSLRAACSPNVRETTRCVAHVSRA